jgi:hypothetical protein
MGSNQSSTMTSITNILLEETVNVMTKNSQSASSDLKLVQTINVEFRGNLKNCGMNSTQSINATQDLKAVVSLQTTSDIQATMSAAIQNTMASAQASVQSFLATAFANQQSKQTIENTIKEAITTNVTTENITAIMATINALQKGTFIYWANVDCGHDQLNITQTMIINQVASMIVESATSAMLKVSQISDAVTKIENDQKSTQKGIAEAISAFGLAILLPLLIIGGVLMLPKLLSSGGKNIPGLEKMAGKSIPQLGGIVEKNPELLAFRSSKRNLRMKCCGK